MRYAAEKDFGTAVAFLVFIAVVIGFGVTAVVIEGIDRGATVAAGILLLLTVLIWIWFWFGTSYEITSTHVRIRCGPIRWRMNLDQIVTAVPTSSVWLMVGGNHARFALSRNAILIRASDRLLGLIPHAVLISPQDRTAFLRELAAAVPNLKFCDDGTVRAQVESTDADPGGNA